MALTKRMLIFSLSQRRNWLQGWLFQWLDDVIKGPSSSLLSYPQNQLVPLWSWRGCRQQLKHQAFSFLSRERKFIPEHEQSPSTCLIGPHPLPAPVARGDCDWSGFTLGAVVSSPGSVTLDFLMKGPSQLNKQAVQRV